MQSSYTARISAFGGFSMRETPSLSLRLRFPWTGREAPLFGLSFGLRSARCPVRVRPAFDFMTSGLTASLAITDAR
jgi:hypothetical protein